MSYDQEALRKVRLEWQLYKDRTGSSQTKAAQALGMNQSAFSQYLQGKIPLNTDFISKFCAMTGASPSDFGVKATASVTAKAVPVRRTISGSPTSKTHVTVETILPNDECYVLEMDYNDHFHRKGTMILCDDNCQIVSGDHVVYQQAPDRPLVVGELKSTVEGWEVMEPLWSGGRRYLVEPSDAVTRVISFFLPQQSGRAFTK